MPGRALGGSAERIEVDDDELERLDRRDRKLPAVVGVPAIGEDPRMDPRMERLHPPVEHLREAGDRGDVRDRHARLAEGPRRPARADQLEAAAHESPGEVHQPRLVRDRQERPPRTRKGRLGSGGVDRDPPPVHVERTAEEERHRVREDPVLHRVEPLEERGLVVAGPDVDRLRQHDRAPVERRVDQVHGHAGHRGAGRQRIADRVRAREARQERRVDVEDAPGERLQEHWTHEAHEARQDDRVGAQGAKRLGERAVSRLPLGRLAGGQARHEGRVEARVRRPLERRAGPVGEDEHDPGREGAARDPALEGSQVAAAPGDANRDPIAHRSTST